MQVHLAPRSQYESVKGGECDVDDCAVGVSAREEEARAPRAAVHRATKPVSRKTSRS